MRTESIVGRGVASPGDARGGQPLDVRLENEAVVVTEVGRGSRGQVRQRPVEEGRHLTAGHWLVRTEQSVRRRVAALGDPRVGQPFDVRGEDVAADVAEGGAGYRHLDSIAVQ